MSDPQNDKLVEHLRRVSGKRGWVFIGLFTGICMIFGILWFWMTARGLSVMTPDARDIPAFLIMATVIHLGAAIYFTGMAICLPLWFLAWRKRSRLIIDMWDRIKVLENREKIVG